MPVTLARPSLAAVASLRERRQRPGVVQDRGRRLRIDLVNNMPDAAVFATQRQFIRLLEEGAASFDVTLGLVTLASVTRGDEARAEMAALYRAPADFAAAAPDAIIVTGAEPRAPELDQEPYWRELTNLFDAARAHSHATLASCLAAHAYVLHRDGVRRRRYARKWSGLYPTEIATPHRLTEGLVAVPTPHSRWNGLDEAELVAKGYLVLTRAGDAGVDMFAKDDDHLALLFQGHPEYDGDTLAREYRRDVGRALKDGAAPAPPVNYYDPETERALRAHVAAMMAGVEAPHLPGYALSAPEATWRVRDGVVIGNWLATISARKAAANGPGFLRARWGG
ncbi:MAG: homoserine O-succinyltransferase [Pseudomonadota bacterium]|nr:homoserine O-succinyltransferase [Pseudomonadota bacterium]